MKPIKLQLQAFESYKDETSIDFTKLVEAGSFLIWGNTGAGKTTIFDGISYALYGKLSQEQKNSANEIKTVGTDEGDDCMECYVTFEFEEKGKKYRITRKPYQHVMGARKKPVSLNSSVLLEFLSEPEKTALSKIGEVEKKVIEIIGLTADQFFQTTLISQGAFAKIITADTKDRQEILRTLFRTNLYLDFTEKLKEKKKDIEEKNGKYSSQLGTMKNGFQLSCEDRMGIDSLSNDNDVVCKLKELQAKYEKENSDLDEKKNEYEIKKTELGKEQLERNAYDSNIREKERSVNEKEKLTLKLTGLLKEQKEIITKEPKIKAFGEKITTLRNKLPDYDRLGNLLLEKAKTEKNIKDCSSKLSVAKNTIDSFDSTKTDKDNEIENLKEIIKPESDLVASQTEISSLSKRLPDMKSLIESLSSEKDEFSRISIKAKESGNAANRLNDEFEAIDRAYYDSMSSIIAKEKLEEGKPCPVCGSVSHPHIHEFTAKDVTKKQYDDAKKSLDEARKKHDSYTNDLENSKNKITDLRSRLNKECVAHGIKGVDESVTMTDDVISFFKNAYSSLFKKYSDELRILANKLQHIKESKKRISALEAEIKKLVDDKDNAVASKTEYEKQLTASNTELKNILDNIKVLKSSLEFDSKESAEKEITVLDSSIKEYEKDKKTNEDNISSYKENIGKEQGSINTLDEKIKSYKGREKQAIIDELTSVNNQLTELDKSRKTISSYISSLESGIPSYESKIKESEKVIADFERIRKLIYVFSGNSDLDMKNKFGLEKGISLETYVLQFYLEQILDRASKRLFQMSEQRFTLKRREEVSTQGQTGLGIDVVDCLSNRSRDASSLSGGETFMASVSLALGLSDYVREQSGGVHIETLFIDEGFGTLDNELLNSVINTVSTLSNGGDVTVGLISHIEELKNTFHAKINVEKDRSGHSKCFVDISL